MPKSQHGLRLMFMEGILVYSNVSLTETLPLKTRLGLLEVEAHAVLHKRMTQFPVNEPSGWIQVQFSFSTEPQKSTPQSRGETLFIASALISWPAVLATHRV